jgi:chromosomal replication initiation ATPase DnaA
MIGRFCGGKDHTTVLHGIKQHCRRHRLAIPASAKPKNPTPASTARATATRLLNDVAAEHGLDPADLVGKSQRKRIAAARFELFYRLRVELPEWSCQKIARFCGRKDHTTVQHGIQAYCWQQNLPLVPAYDPQSAPACVTLLDFMEQHHA